MAYTEEELMDVVEGCHGKWVLWMDCNAVLHWGVMRTALKLKRKGARQINMERTFHRLGSSWEIQEILMPSAAGGK